MKMDENYPGWPRGEDAGADSLIQQLLAEPCPGLAPCRVLGPDRCGSWSQSRWALERSLVQTTI